jgi:hypothetical protein
MDIEQLLVNIIIFMGAFGLGVMLSGRFHRQILNELLRELGIKPQQLEELQHRLASQIDAGENGLELVEIRLEKHQGLIFAYRCDDHQFLGQGTSIEDLTKSLSNRLQGVRLVIRSENGADLLQKNNT